jgi:hypothetical protein
MTAVFVYLHEARRLHAGSLESESKASDAGEQLQDSQGSHPLCFITYSMYS